MSIDRFLNLQEALSKKSHFLFGPRGVGKSSLIKKTLLNAVVIDLLKDDLYSRLLRRPSLLEELLPADNATLVVIDEIQKIPSLLDEVHRIIEERKIRFLLTGSSARKLKHGGANLLGGRAWEMNMLPLTTQELGTQFDLLRYLSYGGLPAIYFSDYPHEELVNYTKLYLREEIQAEGLVRKFDHFVRFLDFVALTNGEELNYDSLGSDAGVPPRTVASYFELLEDTLVGFSVHPYKLSKKRKAISRSKFFLFDVGVVGSLTKRGTLFHESELLGKAIEHFIGMELRACISYQQLDLPLTYWRTTSKHEVDFIVGDLLAVEVKATEKVSEKHLRGLYALQEESQIKKLVLVSRDPVRRTVDGIEIIPWRQFCTELWGGALI
jgi:predicted AAA+ superfamily ATPase